MAATAAEDPTPSWHLRAGSYLGEISALSFLHVPAHLSPLPLLLAGTGSQLLIYDTKSGTLLDSFFAFQGIRVHGIALLPPDADPKEMPSPLVAVFGERRVKLLRLQVDAGLQIRVELVHRLPGFDHWVLDVCFIKEGDVMVVGLSDNSVSLWDCSRSHVIQRVRSSERCLLYSMRMWGDDIETLQVAAGTIYNEIIIWKLSPQSFSSSMEFSDPSKTYHKDIRHVAINKNRLTGHEGSIFRIAWSSDGTKLVSVSDDRSARIWSVGDQRQSISDSGAITDHDILANLTLFGHKARIWDCYISDSIVVTAGEDCTCRVWGKDGSQLLMIKEHIGRGIWRCLYDQVSSLLITGGFDSAIKVRRLCGDPTEHNKVLNDVKDRREIFTISAPKVSQQPGLMDSKSEYIRCLHFTRENTLYVATNNGYLHRVELSDPEDVRWTELARVSKEVPIVCMDLIVSSEISFDAEDMVAIGDGNGNVTVTKVANNGPTYKVASSFTWSAEKERQLLGIFWCKSLGCGHIFTTDPRGVLKLWKIGNALLSDTDNAHLDLQVCHVAVFRSCFGARIVCLDASIENEILICGDQRGNLTLYSLPEGLIVGNSSKTVEILPLVQFKGAHGISSITSILVASLNFDHVELRTTGGDGCICYFKYYKTMQRLEFTGMRKLTELSTIQSIFASSNSEKFLDQGNYAIGFTSADFIVWDLKTEIKMLQIPCGGWRRSYSYHLGPVPEYQNCFAYLKDHIIHIHRLWVPANERKTIAQILHMQCHGREIHSLCFISSRLQLNQNESYLQTEQNESYLWTATGCEDGTVRLTRCMPIYTGSCESKLLGEHVGGSAVRSVYFTSKIYTIGTSQNCQASPDSRDEQFLLISVGAKQVLTSWILRYTELDTHNFTPISFQWLSTHMPPKFSSTHRKVEKISESTENPLSLVLDQNENDWRYLAVTAFLVKHIDSRITVCFIVVSCSDATLILKALLLPYRLWFDVALLVPQTSPVLALQHLVVPGFSHLQDIDQVGNIYIVVSGATDGSITFWDLTETVEYFMKLVLELQPETLIDSQKRPQTGRGSQGGRWWRKLRNPSHDEGSTVKISPGASCMQTIQREVQPLHVLNSIHQSGVNCLHVSRMKGHFHSESETVHCLVSGGDDQAVHCLVFDLIVQDEIISHSLGKGSRNCNYKLRALFEDKINSAHSSAVKGIWTDGIWAFSTGLDQRVRCWRVGSSGRLAEHAHMIISVPEPEALDAVYLLCTYHIAVAGRGMQTVEFCAS